MNNIIVLVICSIAGLATMIGNIMLYIPIKYKDNILSFSFGLSFIVMILISLFELIPEGIKIALNYYNLLYVFIISLILLLFGHLVIKFIDSKINTNNELYRVGLLSMVSMLIHNIPEGVLCAITSSVNIKLGFSLSFAILVHNIPEGICICLPIYYSTNSKLKSILYTFISGGGEIVGAIMTLLIFKRFITPIIIYCIFMITAGIMISLAIRKIFIEGLKIHKYLEMCIGLLIGFVIIVFTL